MQKKVANGYFSGDRLPFTLLFIVIPLYFTHGISEGISFIYQGLVFIWLIIDVWFYVDFVKRKERDMFASIILIFLLVYTLNWMLAPKLVLGFLETWGDWKNVIVVFLTYFPFRKLSKAYDVNSFFKAFAFPITFSCIISFYAKATTFDDREGLTNNAAYYFPVAFPLLGVFLKKKILFAFAIVYLLFVMAGLKRGAIVCFIEEILAMVYFTTMVGSKHKIVSILSASVLLFFLYYILTQILGNNDFLMARIEATMEGKSSGRDDLYTVAWNAFINSNILNQIFGHGIDQSMTFVGNYAHSDWFELLIDLGIIGVLLYLLIFYRLIVIYFKFSERLRASERYIFVSILLCWFTRSIFSMGFTSIEASFFMMGLAPIISKLNVRSNNNENSYSRGFLPQK